MVRDAARTPDITKKTHNPNTDMDAKEIAVESLNIAADICIYTNHNIISETIEL